MTETVYCVAMIFLSILCFCTGYMIGENDGKSEKKINEIEEFIKEMQFIESDDDIII